MLPAIVVENLPRLVRAIKLLPNDPREDAALNLADELTGITAMVAEKFTNERTADGIQKALYLTVGGVSLGLEQAVTHEGDQAALDFLVEHGAEHAFQVGFRLIKELSQPPEDALVGEYDQDPVYLQRRLRELIDFINLPENWAEAQGKAQQRLAPEPAPPVWFRCSCSQRSGCRRRGAGRGLAWASQSSYDNVGWINVAGLWPVRRRDSQ